MNGLIQVVSEVQFLNPGWFWVWPPLVIAITVLLYRSRLDPIDALPQAVSLVRYRHPAFRLLRELTIAPDRKSGAPFDKRRLVVYAIATLGMVTTLAHPFRLGEELPAPPEYRDTIFLVDSSISMLRRDYLVDGKRVDRMTMLKSVLTHFIDQLEGNRISVIAFSEQSYTLAPLTADYDFLRAMVRRLEPALFTGSRSDLGRAMLYTLRKIQHTDAEPDNERPAIVLLTDVNRPVRDIDPRAAATYLAEQGYRLHVIAIGAPSYAADENAIASLIYHPVSFDLLKKIAANAGGQFFWAKDIGSLKQAMLTIQHAERRAIDTAPRHVPVSLYQWPLIASVAWIVVMQLWHIRRGS
ncbi:MAG: VWA domain-containing protein [Acidiferrobacterales bacterium]|nr:VWA domain-containing protein [Acidiferrobacterales bacterium]